MLLLCGHLLAMIIWHIKALREEELPFLPVAPEHAWRASSIMILPWSADWRRFHATRDPVIPLPMMTVSAVSGTCSEER